MRFTAPQPELAAAAQWVARQLPHQPLQPALMTMRLHADRGRLSLSGFDGETAVQASIDAGTAASGEARASARLLADVLATLGKSDDVTVDTAGADLVLTTTRASVTLPTADGQDAPTPPPGPSPVGVVDGAALAAAYKKVKAAVDPKAASRLAGMSGVRLRTDGDRLQLAATDSYRVAQAWIAWTAPPSQTALGVVPDKVLASAVSLHDGPVEMALPDDGQGTARLSGHRGQVCTALLDPGTYPHRVDEVVPTDFTGTATFEAAEAIEALRQVSAITEEGRPIWLRLDQSGATLSASDHGTATVRVDADWSGDAFEAAWNARFLGDGLAAATGPVRMQVTDPKRPAVLTAPDDSTYRYTVVPIARPRTSREASA